MTDHSPDSLVLHAFSSVIKVLLKRLGGEVDIQFEELMALDGYKLELQELPNHGRRLLLQPRKEED